MTALVIWLYTRPQSLFLHILGMTALPLAWSILATILVVMLNIPQPDWMELEDKPVEYRFAFVLFLLLGAPINSLIEELLFRAPLSIVGKIWPGHQAGLRAGVISSIIFGFIHGGLATIPMQGVLGMVLAMSYLKCGGIEGRFWKPYLVTVTIHTLYNLPLLCMGTAGTFIELMSATK